MLDPHTQQTRTIIESQPNNIYLSTISPKFLAKIEMLWKLCPDVIKYHRFFPYSFTLFRALTRVIDVSLHHSNLSILFTLKCDKSTSAVRFNEFRSVLLHFLTFCLLLAVSVQHGFVL